MYVCNVTVPITIEPVTSIYCTPIDWSGLEDVRTVALDWDPMLLPLDQRCL